MTKKDNPREALASRQNGKTFLRYGSATAARDVTLLDLAHLTRQCLGDSALEIELLREFRAQSLLLSARLEEGDHLALASKADIAHRLRGSALAVGARAIAQAAEIVEACGRASAIDGRDGAAQIAKMANAIARLGEVVQQTVAEIDRVQP